MILGSGGITASPSLEEDDVHMVLGISNRAFSQKIEVDVRTLTRHRAVCRWKNEMKK